MTTATETAVLPAIQAAIDQTAVKNVSLADRAMLAKFSVAGWNATKSDRKASREVAKQNNAAQSATNVVKVLAGAKDRSSTAKEKLETIRKIGTAARTYHYSMTLLWLDDGARILCVDAYDEYTRTIADFIDQYDAAVLDFLPFYPTLVHEASLGEDQGGLGALWKASDYPPASEIASYFAMSSLTLPMPSAPDFRADIGEIEIQRVRRQLEGVISQVMAESTRDLIVRIIKPIAHMAESLRDYKITEVAATDKNGRPTTKTQVENKFHDTVVENVRKQAALIPLLNVNHDPLIADLAADIQASLTKWDADVLRASDSTRAAVAGEAERIKAKADAMLKHASEFFA
jgi:hypothetical protein